MFCIAAFIILGLISIFSASQRKLAKKAWGCTMRRVTFRPCDTSFKDEMKNRLLAKVANRTPRLVTAADITIEAASFMLVILTIWSLFVGFKSGLNLFVWGTCNPINASSCSLGSESCSIDRYQPSFWTTLKQGKPWVWVSNEAKTFGNTLANIPTRLQKWEASDYLPQNATYYYEYDKTKPTAIEILDPGCSVCAQLFKNIKQAGFEKRYNLTYLAYPIPKQNKDGSFSYKYANSLLVAQYLEALKINPLNTSSTPADWQILERIFTWIDTDKVSYQIKINAFLNSGQTEELIKKWLGEIGYSRQQISRIEKDADSQRVTEIIQANQQIVENKIKTLKIPSIIYDSRRHDGLIQAKDL